MAETKERRKAPRAPRKATTKAEAPTPRPDSPGMSTEARATASSEEIRQLIAETAYYKAKQRGFTPGHELEDWVQAESEVMRRVDRST